MIKYIFNYGLMLFQIYEFILFIYIIASWFGGLPRNKFGYFITDLVKPILQFVKQVPHRFGIIDLSPIYAFVLINFLRMIFISLF